MALTALLLRVCGLLPQSDPIVVFVFLELFVMATISFCFLVSTIFSRASTAAAVSGIIWFISYVPYFFLGPNYSSFGVGIKEGLSIFSTTAMAVGANVIAAFEGQGFGVQWNNLNTPVSVDDAMTFATVWVILVLDTVLYALLTWYIEAVFPGEFGIPQPWNFFMKASYWRGASATVSDERTPLIVRQATDFLTASTQRHTHTSRRKTIILHRQLILRLSRQITELGSLSTIFAKLVFSSCCGVLQLT